MTLIRINLEEAIASESAKASAYKMAKVNGDLTLVIDSTHKSTLSSMFSLTRKAKKLAIGALKARIKSDSDKSAAERATGTPKQRLVLAYKKNREKSSADAKEAKDMLREASALLKSAGLSSLKLPLTSSMIVLTSEPGRSARAVAAAQADQLIVKGHKGTFKPKYIKAASLDNLESQTVKKAPAAKAPAKKASAKNGAGISGHKPEENLYFAAPSVKTMIAKYAAKPDADLSKMSIQELSSASDSFDKKARRADTAGRRSSGSGANAYDSVRDAHKRVKAEIDKRLK